MPARPPGPAVFPGVQTSHTLAFPFSSSQSLPKVCLLMLTPAVPFAQRSSGELCDRAHANKEASHLGPFSFLPSFPLFFLFVFIFSVLSFINKELCFKNIISPSSTEITGIFEYSIPALLFTPCVCLWSSGPWLSDSRPSAAAQRSPGAAPHRFSRPRGRGGKPASESD